MKYFPVKVKLFVFNMSLNKTLKANSSMQYDEHGLQEKSAQFLFGGYNSSKVYVSGTTL